MSGIDRNIRIEMFNEFDYNNTTRYTDKPSDVGDEVERNWADLGIYGNK